MQETNLWFCQVDSFFFHVPYQPVTNLQHFRILDQLTFLVLSFFVDFLLGSGQMGIAIDS